MLTRRAWAECAICGKPISESFWVCEACQRGYGLGDLYSQWPEWVKHLKEKEQRRRRERDRTVEVIPVSLLGPRERQEIERLFYGEQE